MLQRDLIDVIKYPILTDKTTKLLEENQYCFAVKSKANKDDIKNAIEYIFKVRVKKVRTLNITKQKRNLGRFQGGKKHYKKAIIKLHLEDTINLFAEN